MPGTNPLRIVLPEERAAWERGNRTGISLRARYTMSGTDIAYGASCLRARYAMSVTEIAYGAAIGLRATTSCTAYCAISLCAMSGTNVAYGGTRAWVSDGAMERG
eukprot:1747421-Rhodomonas_salina.2